jgi:deoxyribodipyrimidine photo-lyase
VRSGAEYVLYWVQLYRRLARNHALEHALAWASRLGRPLVVYEGVRLDYPWASERLHRFLLEGMRENAVAAERHGLNYWPFVATPERSGRGLLRSLAARAALVVTDDYPGFIVPHQSQALAARIDVPVFAVDGNGLVPLSMLGPAASAAVHLRRRLHKALLPAWQRRSRRRLVVPTSTLKRVTPPFELWAPDDLDATLDGLPLDRSVPPVAAVGGGRSAALARLRRFVRSGLPGYAEKRSVPGAPATSHGSGLSPYLHFGHVSVDEITEAVLGAGFSPERLRLERVGRREGFFGADTDTDAFLDQVVTWRDLGFLWQRRCPGAADRLDTALPAWALATLRQHAGDPRRHVYTPEELESAATHDPVWNAAQQELVRSGTIHNYLRMLWGKKLLEWSRSPDEAYATAVHLNNKYALDGRDPNSYSGILWCFGLFDRPWGPERPVFGKVRYMSSESTARKFRLGPYLEYVRSLEDQSSSPSTNHASRMRSR